MPYNRRNFGKVIKYREKKIAQGLKQMSARFNSDGRKNTPLHWAILKFKRKYINVINMFLYRGADIHAKNHNNYTALDIAILKGKTEAVRLLIRRGALAGEDMNLLLLKAVDGSNLEIVEILINHGILNNSSIDFQTVLNAAILQGNPEMIEHIISHCRFLESADKYIPRDLVLKSGLQYKESVELLLKNWNFTIIPNSHYDQDFIYGAVENGHFLIVLDLLKYGIDVNAVNSKTGLNLLTIACLNGHHQIVEKLLEHNADINLKISNQKIALSRYSRFSYDFKRFYNLSTRNNSIDLRCIHISVFNSDPTTTDILLKYGATIEDYAELFNLTCIAVRNGCKEIVSRFLDLGVKVTDVSSDGINLLDFCVNFSKKDNGYDIAKLLLEKGAYIHLQTPRNKHVYWAIICKQRKIAQLFLNYNADIQYTGLNECTVFQAAVQNGFSIKFIQSLLKLNSSVDFVNSPLSDLCLAKPKNQLKILDILVHYNANLNHVDRYWGTPLYCACFSNNLQLIKALVNQGANVNITNNNGDTPLHEACLCRATLEIARFLVEHGANIEAVNNDGWTPLFYACDRNKDTTVKFLLDHHANPNHIDFENSTPLHIAVERSSVKMTKNLIKHCANINSLNKNNKTALQLAVEFLQNFRSRNFERDFYGILNYEEIIKILQTQVVKLFVAGLKVNDENLKIVYGSKYLLDNQEDFVQKLDKECKEEIHKMKKENISITGETDINDEHVTFEDLLKKHDHFLRRFIYNEDIQAILELPIYNKKYPLYINIIRSRFQNVKYRYNATNSAREYFSKKICQRMPNDCIDIFLSYLNITELTKFNQAMNH